MYATAAAIDELNRLLISSGIQLEIPLEPRTETLLSRFLTETGIDSLDTLVLKIVDQGNKALLTQVIQALTLTQPQFFRDYKNFKFIRKAVFPYLAKKTRNSPLSVLVIGDSTGTDAYSLSILADESTWGTERELRITGYDISKTKIQHYRQGIFSSVTIASSMPASFVKSHFDNFDRSWQIKERHRSRTYFETARPELPWPRKESYDLVFIRNAMAYLPKASKEKAMAELSSHLIPGSFVVTIGGSEILSANKDFKLTQVEGIRCYRYKVTNPKASAKKSAGSNTATQEFRAASALLEEPKNKPKPVPKKKDRGQKSFALELADFARKVYLFDRMPPAELDDICDRVQVCAFTPGETILTQGEKGDGFFIIKSGEVRVEINQGKIKGPLKVAELKRGQIFGEMSLILDEPCSASVISETDVTAYLFDQKLFDYLRFENDLFAEKLDEIVLERRADTANKKAEETTRLEKEKLSAKPAPKTKASPKIRTVQVPMTDERFASLVRHVRDVSLLRI